MIIKTDMVMDVYYAHDKLQELWQNISILHFKYLEMDETPEKLEQRNKLEDCIREYLYLTSHNKKFVLQETPRVLHQSASLKKDFSGYRASLGWSAIGIYASNLLSQPWRKEYKKIKMYSGFYKHQIEANLVGAEEMFEAMGYRYDRNNFVLIMDGPVCPDRVINVSQDSLVAYVECQILKTIWEEVSANFKISWLEVLEFRENHLCNPKQSVLALSYRYHEKQYMQNNHNYSQANDPFANIGTRCIPSISNIYCPPVTVNHSIPPQTHSHVHVPSLPLPVQSNPQCVYGSNGYFPNNFSNYAPILPSQSYPSCNYSVPCAQSLGKCCHSNNSNNNNNCCCLNGYSVGLPQDYIPQPTIPTAQLVDIETRCNTYDVPDGRHPRQATATLYGETSNMNNVNSDKDEAASPGNIESWDYVYRSLESQGYTKDMGERGDLLTNNSTAKKVKNNLKKTGLEESFNNLSIKKVTNNKDKHEVEKKAVTNVSSSKVESPPKKTTVAKITSGLQDTLSRKNDNSKTKSFTAVLKKTRNKEDKNAGEKINEWECSYCTYLNKYGIDICEMCGKSKTAVDEVMEVGGSQCPQCTLVNPKNINYCKACEHSLANSPTYI